jgi:hypothetical protein
MSFSEAASFMDSASSSALIVRPVVVLYAVKGKNAAANPFKWRHYPGDINHVVRTLVSSLPDFGGKDG